MSFETVVQTALTKLRIDLRQLRADFVALQGVDGTPAFASETAAGIIEIATASEITAATANNLAVTPLSLQSRLVAYAQEKSANLSTLADVVSGITGRSLLGAATAGAAKTTLALVKSDVGLANVDNTADSSKPVSAPQQLALDLKLNTANAPTKTSLGLGNVDNTSDAAKPVSTATQTALNLKADTTALPTKTSLGLGNVDNTSDLAKPVSTATQTALNLKLNTSDAPTKTSIGLGNVDNTSDVNKPVSTATQTALNLKLNSADAPTKASLGLANVDNTSDVNKPVSSATQAALNLKSDNVPATETVAGVQRLATQAETNAGTDDTRSVTPLKFHTRLLAYAQPLSSSLTTLSGVVSGAMGRQLLGTATPTAAKQLLGTTKGDVGLGNVDNTSDVNKPVSTAAQTALNLKLDTTAAPTKTSLGLDNVDNTSDANKPVSTATQTALNLKLNSADAPTKVSLGLDNVDNTSDTTKPVSTATQTALNLKANLDSPTLVGLARAPTVMSGDSTDLIATTNYVQAAIGDITGGSSGVIDGGGVNEGYPTPPDLHDGGAP